MFSKIFKSLIFFAKEKGKQMLRHKLIIGIVLLVIIIGGYFGYHSLFKTKSTVQYVTAAVEKGTIISSVSGSGQVSALNQVDIKAKASGDVVYVGAKNGQEVKAGALLAQIDSRDAQKTVWNAEVSLERAKVDLEKMKGITTDEGNIRGNKEKAADDLKKAYEDGFNTVANVFLDLPNVMAGLDDILFSTTPGAGGQQNIDSYTNAVREYSDQVLQLRDDVYTKYNEARQAYGQNFTDYKATSRFSDTQVIDKLISQTYDTVKIIAEAIKSTNNLIQFYRDKAKDQNLTSNSLYSLSTTHLSNLNTYTGKTNSHLLNLLSIKNTIQSDKETIAGVNFDITDQEITVKQAENTLSQAKEKLADYFVYAPFSGVIAEMNIKKGDSISASTAIATFITKQRIAEITLNEVDVAKVKVGQKATLTFDAIPDLSIAGEVSEIDAIGTVSQGVVSYAVKITFDTQDERVKPGMSVSTAIITDSKQNVLIVSNSAIKQQGDSAYVEVMVNNMPQQRTVETGLTNDTVTEIVNGLQEGEQIVTQTITANTTQTQSQSNTGFRIPGLGGR